MPRSLARTENEFGYFADRIGGYDVWHCHEATFLWKSGRPISGTLKFSYSAQSKFMVESKSMKLFLNSFDMCKLSSVAAYTSIIKDVLSDVLETDVRVNFFADQTKCGFVDKCERVEDTGEFIMLDYEDFLPFPYVYDGSFTAENISAWQLSPSNRVSYFTNSLRSRCRHTKQKDTGSALITCESGIPDKPRCFASPESAFRAIVSLREVNEFHEFCAERLLKLFSDSSENMNFTVALFYARRGSLDINPVRWIAKDDKNQPPISLHPAVSKLIDVSKMSPRTQGQ